MKQLSEATLLLFVVFEGKRKPNLVVEVLSTILTPKADFVKVIYT